MPKLSCSAAHPFFGINIAFWQKQKIIKNNSKKLPVFFKQLDNYQKYTGNFFYAS
jgi:hypothetical protein